MPELYQSADSEYKRHIVSSMFPEKLTFDGEQHRTLRINEAIRVFDSVKAVFESKKDHKPGVKSDLRSKVTLWGVNCLCRSLLTSHQIIRTRTWLCFLPVPKKNKTER
jgi:hypothetical protein